MRMNNRNRFCSAGLALAALLLCACPQVETPPASEPGFDIHIYESSTGRGMPIPKEKLYVPHYGAYCVGCSMKIVCNGCSECGKCKEDCNGY